MSTIINFIETYMFDFDFLKGGFQFSMPWGVLIVLLLWYCERKYLRRKPKPTK